MNKEQLDKKTVTELKTICRQNDIKGYSTKRKDSLVKLIIESSYNRNLNDDIVINNYQNENNYDYENDRCSGCGKLDLSCRCGAGSPWY